MRFTRLKKNIEADSSVSRSSSSQTARQKTGDGDDRKTNAKKRKIEKHVEPADLKVAAVSKSKKKSAEPEILAPSAPCKRQTRGKTIDVSAAFESDASPTPGVQVRQEDDTSDYEQGQQTGRENDGPFDDGEIDQPAKRRGSSVLSRKTSQPYFKHKIPSYRPSTPVAESDAGQLPPTSAAPLSCLNGIVPGAEFTTIRTPTQAPTDLTSLHIAQLIHDYPTPATSNTISSTVFHPAIDHALPFDIMPSIKYDTSNDGASEAKLMGSITAVAGSSASTQRGTTLGDSTRPNAFA